jgi:hypothetical protein
VEVEAGRGGADAGAMDVGKAGNNNLFKIGIGVVKKGKPYIYGT